MTDFWDELAISQESRVTHVLGVRCRSCEYVNPPFDYEDDHWTCAHCGETAHIFDIPTAESFRNFNAKFEYVMWVDSI